MNNNNNNQKGTLVYHLIHVTTPYQRIPRLLVVGDFFDKGEIEAAGYSFGEFGIPWANYRVLHFNSIDEIPSDALAAIRRGEVERYSAEEFRKKINAPL